jgi:four helix bundle protein
MLDKVYFGFWNAECGLFYGMIFASTNLEIQNLISGMLVLNERDLKKRTKKFAKVIIQICRTLPQNREGRLIGNQLFRSGTSVAANYRAACRGRSKAEFISKMAIVEEEADETHLWLELIKEMKISTNPLIDNLLKESNELLAITVASIKTVIKSL